MSGDFPVPPELLYEILTLVMRDCFHEYIMNDDDQPVWNAQTTCLLVSRRFRDCTSKIISQTMKITEPDESQSLTESPRKTLQFLQRTASVARFQPDLISREFNDNPQLLPLMKKQPYTYIYMAYLAARSGRRQVMDGYGNADSLQNGDNQLAFSVRTASIKRLLLSALKTCDDIIPRGMSASIGVCLAEEEWILTTLFTTATLSSALGALLDCLPAYVDHPLFAELFLNGKALERTFKALQSGFSPKWNTERTRYIAAYGIPQSRVDELRKEILEGFPIISRLQEIADSPSLKKADPFGIARQIHALLAQLGFE